MPLVKKWQLDKHEDDSDIHHREWNWADEQGYVQEFVLPFTEQYGWTKQGSIFQKGATGKFDDYGVHHPSVVLRNSYYYLFYTGIISGNYYNGIGVTRATSPTGAYGRLNNGDPIIPRGSYANLGVPSVVYDDYETDANKKWKMWMIAKVTGERFRVYYSYSANPDSGWSTPTMVYQHVTDDIAAVGCLRLGNLYYLGVKRLANIELLTASTPTGTYTLRHTLLTVGASGAWDDASVDYFSLIYILGVFYLFYSGNDGTNYRIGVAFDSYGGMTGSAFTKYIMNPILNIGTAGQFDVTHAFKPFVMQVESKFYMWYTGVNPTDRQIGLATIP